MSHPTRWTLEVNKQIEINTDPQRRCYNGCHAKSEMVWTGWQEMCNPISESEGIATLDCFQKINPGRKYRLIPPTIKGGTP